MGSFAIYHADYNLQERPKYPKGSFEINRVINLYFPFHIFLFSVRLVKNRNSLDG